MKDTTNGSGSKSEAKRVPFKKGEREQTLELLCKHILQLDDLKEKRKKVEEKIELLKEDIRAGGYLDDAQGSIPGTEDHDEAEARA